MTTELPFTFQMFPTECYPITIEIYDVASGRTVWEVTIPEAPAIINYPGHEALTERNHGEPIGVRVALAAGAQIVRAPDIVVIFPAGESS